MKGGKKMFKMEWFIGKNVLSHREIYAFEERREKCGQVALSEVLKNGKLGVSEGSKTSIREMQGWGLLRTVSSRNKEWEAQAKLEGG